MGKGKGSTDEYPFMQTPDLLSHFLHLGYTNSTLSPIWAPTVRRTPPLTLIEYLGFDSCLSALSQFNYQRTNPYKDYTDSTNIGKRRQQTVGMGCTNWETGLTSGGISVSPFHHDTCPDFTCSLHLRRINP